MRSSRTCICVVIVGFLLVLLHVQLPLDAAKLWRQATAHPNLDEVNTRLPEHMEDTEAVPSGLSTTSGPQDAMAGPQVDQVQEYGEDAELIDRSWSVASGKQATADPRSESSNLQLQGYSTHTHSKDSEAAHAPTRIPFQGRNLILVGDSNDRNFIDVLCRSLTGKFDGKTYFTQLSTKDFTVRWPEASQVTYCHDTERNASVMFLFHPGLGSISPQPPWFHELMLRRGRTHELQSNPGRSFSSTDLGLLIWPHVIRANLSPRPLLVLMQSSLWDAIGLLEQVVGGRISQAKPIDIERQLAHPITESNLTDWDWLGRASTFVSTFYDSLLENGFHVEQLLWRTNPNCPTELKDGSRIINAVSELQSIMIRGAVAKAEKPWKYVSLVDWRAHNPIFDPKQCDKHHYSKDGYNLLLKALQDVVQI